MIAEEVLEKVRPWHCLKDPDLELPALLGAIANAKSFLEVGTFQGATSAAVRLMYPSMAITTIDLPDPTKTTYNPQSSDMCGEAIRALDVQGIEQLRMDSAEISTRWLGASFDAVFVDGDHSKMAVLRDLTSSAKLLSKKGVIIAHDYTEPGDAERPWWTVDVYDAVEMFLSLNPEFVRTRMPGWLVSLRRN